MVHVVQVFLYRHARPLVPESHVHQNQVDLDRPLFRRLVDLAVQVVHVRPASEFSITGFEYET